MYTAAFPCTSCYTVLSNGLQHITVTGDLFKLWYCCSPSAHSQSIMHPGLNTSPCHIIQLVWDSHTTYILPIRQLVVYLWYLRICYITDHFHATINTTMTVISPATLPLRFNIFCWVLRRAILPACNAAHLTCSAKRHTYSHWCSSLCVCGTCWFVTLQPTSR